VPGYALIYRETTSEETGVTEAERERNLLQVVAQEVVRLERRIESRMTIHEQRHHAPLRKLASGTGESRVLRFPRPVPIPLKVLEVEDPPAYQRDEDVLYDPAEGC
jgi:hypothetical protein